MTALARGERTARVILATISDPGDVITGRLVRTFGAVAAVEIVTGDTVPGVDRVEGEVWQRRLASRLDGVHIRRVLDDTAKQGLELVIPGDESWPSGMSELGALAPFALWAKGNTDLLTASVAERVTITGARAATSYGLHVVIGLAAGAIADARQVVSGGAYGIDAQAHRAALADRGPTIAVLAGGLDRPYPAGNQDLLHRIGQDGLLVSEIPPGEPPTRWRFQQRARLLAVLSGAVVVVEAGYRSGALTAAARAVELGRRVGAVPGPVTSATSAGTHRLLAEGIATIVTNYADIRALLEDRTAPTAPVAPSRAEPQFGTRPAQRSQGTSGPAL